MANKRINSDVKKLRRSFLAMQLLPPVMRALYVNQSRRNAMAKFNSGNSYHGSEAVMNGGLTGATDTDYFYFFCPKCPDKHIMRVLDYEVRSEESENPYNSELSKKAKRGFTLAFELYCENCKHQDFVKISNTGLQGDTHDQALHKSNV